MTGALAATLDNYLELFRVYDIAQLLQLLHDLPATLQAQVLLLCLCRA